MLLQDLLKGFDATKHINVEEIVKLLNANATEAKAKVLIDDGDKDVFVPKARLDEEIGKKKQIQDTLTTTNTELETLKKAAGDNKELTDKIAEMQKANAELDGKLKNQALETAIKLKAIELKAKDKSGADVLAFIDKAKLTLTADGTVTGLDEALKAVTESKPYLFDEADAGGTGNPGQQGKGGSGTEITGIGEKLAKSNEGATGTDLASARANYFK